MEENKKLEYLEIIPDKVNNLFILLHGYGADNEDLIALAINFRTLLPNTAFILVNAPCKCDTNCGYQWFSLKTMNLFSILKEIKISHNLLNKFIDEQLSRFSLENRNLLLGGFSQGAMMTLYTGLRRESEPLGLLSFSGMMAETVETLRKELRCRPETLLIHGTGDRTVPYSNLERAESLLREFDVPFEAHIIHAMGHEINEEAVEYARDFIRKICNKIE